LIKWDLPYKFKSSDGEIVFNIIGNGQPIVFVHGTPSWSYLWRNVIKKLKTNWTIYVYDLLGYGNSERNESQDVSIKNQAKILNQLLQYWNLEKDKVHIVGHDIGGAIVLSTNLIEKYIFNKIILIDAVIITPWITSTTVHQKKYIECYKTMPTHIYEQIALAHIRTAFYKEPPEDILMNYFNQWRGKDGQSAWYKKVEQFDESITTKMEKMYNKIDAPIQLLWGEYDEWLKSDVANKAKMKFRNAELEFISKAGHFSPEDNPEEISVKINNFLKK